MYCCAIIELRFVLGQDHQTPHFRKFTDLNCARMENFAKEEVVPDVVNTVPMAKLTVSIKRFTLHLTVNGIKCKHLFDKNV